MTTNVLAAPATQTQLTSVAPKKWVLWSGRALSAMPTFMLLMSAAMKLSGNPKMVDMLTKAFGYPAGAGFAIGILELVSTVLYVIPRTAVLGAILVTDTWAGRLPRTFASETPAGRSFPSLSRSSRGAAFSSATRASALSCRSARTRDREQGGS